MTSFNFKEFSLVEIQNKILLLYATTLDLLFIRHLHSDQPRTDDQMDAIWDPAMRR